MHARVPRMTLQTESRQKNRILQVQRRQIWKTWWALHSVGGHCWSVCADVEDKDGVMHRRRDTMLT